MRRIPGLLYNVTGQLLELRFPLGRPTSATFSVMRAWADDDATAEFSGAGTVDTVNTTSSAAAGPAQSDPQRIPLTSTAGITTGRRYVISANGLQESVQPLEVGTGYVRVRTPLQNDYASGATFVGTTITAAVDGTFIADRSKLSDLSDTFPDYRVRWSIVYAGATYPLYSFFDVVRAQISHDVDISDINERAPGLHTSLPTEYRADDGRTLPDAAWRVVRARMVTIGVDPNSIRDDEVIDELVIRAALQVLAEGGWAPKGLEVTDYIEVTTKNFDRFFEQHFAVAIKHRRELQLGSLSTTAAAGAGQTPFFKK